MAFNEVFYNICRILCSIAFRCAWGLRVYGLKNVPRKGGFIIASNHASAFDPPFLGVAISNRSVRYLAKAELFENRFLSWLIKSLGAFPIKRGVIDRKPIRILAEMVEQGNAVVVFLEGARTKTGELQEAKAGFGMMACHAHSTVVVPAYVDSFGVWPKGSIFPETGKKVSIIFGRPIPLTKELAMPHSRKTYEAIAAKVMAEIKKLKAELESLNKES